MPDRELLVEADINRLPPMIFGVVRWNRSVGMPAGGVAVAFKVTVEEKTPSQWFVGQDGLPDMTPGHWKTVSPAPLCSQAPDEGDQHVAKFVVAGVHQTVLDGKYRVLVQVAGDWGGRGLVQYIRGYRVIQPLAWYVAVKEHGFSVVEFEVVMRQFSLFGLGS